MMTEMQQPDTDADNIDTDADNIDTLVTDVDTLVTGAEDSSVSPGSNDTASDSGESRFLSSKFQRGAERSVTPRA